MIYVFLGWDFERILSYLKSAPSNLFNCKILRKKLPNFWTKMPYLGIFAHKISKATLIFEINTFKFV